MDCHGKIGPVCVLLNIMAIPAGHPGGPTDVSLWYAGEVGLWYAAYKVGEHRYESRGRVEAFEAIKFCLDAEKAGKPA